MKRKLRSCAWGLLWLWLAAGLWACGGKKEAKTAEKAAQSGIVPVKTWIAERGVMEKTLRVTGDIRAAKETRIGPAMPGRIQRIHVREGQRIAQGDLLVTMDDASLKSAEAAYVSAKADYERALELQKASNIAPTQFEKIKVGYETAQSQHRMLSENTLLRAPFSGVVGSVYAQEGDVYSGMTPTQAGGPAVLTLHDLSRVKVLCRVSDADLPLVREGLAVRFFVDVLGSGSFSGQIASLSRAADGMSRSYGLEITGANPGQTLKPGMFARCEIILEARKNVLAVPSDAVLDSARVFVVKNDTAFARRVQTGLATPQQTEILSGLEAGEELVTEGNYGMKDSSAVQRTK